MEGMTFSREEKERMVAKVQAYFEREMDQSLGGFEAEFLIYFFASEMGAFFYNRGLYDAEAAITAKLADISVQLLELERPL